MQSIITVISKILVSVQKPLELEHRWLAKTRRDGLPTHRRFAGRHSRLHADDGAIDERGEHRPSASRGVVMPNVTIFISPRQNALGSGTLQPNRPMHRTLHGYHRDHLRALAQREQSPGRTSAGAFVVQGQCKAASRTACCPSPALNGTPDGSRAAP